MNYINFKEKERIKYEAMQNTQMNPRLRDIRKGI